MDTIPTHEARNIMDTELARLDAVGQASLLRDGQASAAELVESAIDRITALNPSLNAVIFERFEAALEESRGPLTGPFAGVPLLLKDLGCPAAGQPDHQGSIALKTRGHLADHDCAIVRRFKSAGFVILGRTNVPEFGLVSDTQNAAYGSTRNPWNLEHTAGGSSGGSGAAVASGMVPVAHGNDGGGSLRIPGSHCGLVGLKPSRGRVSHAPDSGDPMLGHVVSGVLTRTVRDTAAVLDVLAGPEPGDPCIPPAPPTRWADTVGRGAPLRIGFVRQTGSQQWPVHPACAQAVEVATSLLAELGHDVHEDHPEALFEEVYWQRWFDALSPTITSAVKWVSSLAPGSPNEFDPITMLWAERGRELSASALVETLDWMDGYRRRMAAWWSAGHDLLVCPVYVMPPQVRGSFWESPQGITDSVDILRFTPQFNTTGQPAISVPILWTDDDLPVGVQLVAAYGRDDLLLAAAAEIEAARPWMDRYPAHARGAATAAAQ
jgi:amidase